MRRDLKQGSVIGEQDRALNSLFRWTSLRKCDLKKDMKEVGALAKHMSLEIVFQIEQISTINALRYSPVFLIIA